MGRSGDSYREAGQRYRDDEDSAGGATGYADDDAVRLAVIRDCSQSLAPLGQTRGGDLQVPTAMRDHADEG